MNARQLLSAWRMLHYINQKCKVSIKEQEKWMEKQAGFHQATAMLYGTIQHLKIGWNLDNLGASSGYIASNGNQGISSCPYNVTKDAWKYWNDAWIIADANDISIECLTGNDIF